MNRKFAGLFVFFFVLTGCAFPSAPPAVENWKKAVVMPWNYLPTCNEFRIGFDVFDFGRNLNCQVMVANYRSQYTHTSGTEFNSAQTFTVTVTNDGHDFGAGLSNGSYARLYEALWAVDLLGKSSPLMFPVAYDDPTQSMTMVIPDNNPGFAFKMQGFPTESNKVVLSNSLTMFNERQYGVLRTLDKGECVAATLPDGSWVRTRLVSVKAGKAHFEKVLQTATTGDTVWLGDESNEVVPLGIVLAVRSVPGKEAVLVLVDISVRDVLDQCAVG